MTDAAKIGMRTGQPADWFGIARRYGAWLLLAAVFAVLPKIFASGTSLTMMSLMGFMIVTAVAGGIVFPQSKQFGSERLHRKILTLTLLWLRGRLRRLDLPVLCCRRPRRASRAD